MLSDLVFKSFIAGILASLACGLGALPLAWKRLDVQRRSGLGFAFAAGLMLTASIVNLIMEGLTLGMENGLEFWRTLHVVCGMLSGAVFLWVVHKFLSEERMQQQQWKRWGSRKEVLIFLAMAVHSIPEGVAVGVGFVGEEHYQVAALGKYIALAIAIHNIPEGLTVAIPMRAAGATIQRCFLAAFLTSLPQPIAAVPATMFSWFFRPMMPAMMGFAGGAMIFLVVMEMLPEAIEKETSVRVAWAVLAGFSAMLLIQVVL